MEIKHTTKYKSVNSRVSLVLPAFGLCAVLSSVPSVVPSAPRARLPPLSPRGSLNFGKGTISPSRVYSAPLVHTASTVIQLGSEEGEDVLETAPLPSPARATRVTYDGQQPRNRNCFPLNLLTRCAQPCFNTRLKHLSIHKRCRGPERSSPGGAPTTFFAMRARTHPNHPPNPRPLVAHAIPSLSKPSPPPRRTSI
jgi:hypothetical protein